MMYMYAPQKKGIVEFMQYLLIDFFAIEGQDLASDGLDLEMTSKFIAKKSQEWLLSSNFNECILYQCAE